MPGSNKSSGDEKIDYALRQALKTPGTITEETMFWLVEKAKGMSLVVEVGAWRGRTTMVLASLVKMILAVDTWEPNPKKLRRDSLSDAMRKVGGDELFTEYCLRFSKEIREGRVVPLRSNSKRAAGMLFGHMFWKKADMVFIDAERTELAVDIRAFGPLVREGGIICGLGYCERWPEVMRDVEGHAPGFQRGPSSIWWKEV